MISRDLPNVTFFPANRELLLFFVPRCTDFVEKLVAREHTATSSTATATTASQQDNSPRSPDAQRETDAETRCTEVQAQEAAGLGQHDEGGRDRQKAQTRQMQRP